MNIVNQEFQTTEDIKYETAYLLKKMYNGDILARQRIIELNLPLVIYIANKYCFLACLDDLIQEGAIGLIKAVDTYKDHSNYKFHNWLAFGIRKYIIAEIYRQRSVSVIKPRLAAKIYHLKLLIENMTQNLEYEPSFDELAQVMNHRPKTIEKMLYFGQIPKSLYEEIIIDPEFEGSVPLIENICSPKQLSPEESLLENEVKTYTNYLLSFLSPRSKKIFLDRASLNFEEKRQLNELGAEFGITKERARQIEAKAKTKLKDLYHYY